MTLNGTNCLKSCTILGKVCDLVIDNGSIKNIVSSALVESLKLLIIDHPKPYKLGCIKNVEPVYITKQCRVPLSIGKHYRDEIICDVVDMKVCQLLLGHAWHFDVNATLLGRDNIYKFCKKWEKDHFASFEV